VARPQPLAAALGNSDIQRDPDAFSHTNAFSDAHAQCHTNAECDSHTICDAHTQCDTHAVSDSNSDKPDALGNSDAQRHDGVEQYQYGIRDDR